MRLSRVALVVGLLAALVPASGATASAAGLSLTRVEPRAAVAGAAIALRGTRLAGKTTRVTIGGRAAKILSRSARRLVVVIPKVPPGQRPVLVRSGRRVARGRLTVLKPFRGKLAPRLDRRRAVARTIGPAGGQVTARGADGVGYVLTILPGALAAEHPITVTPITEIPGLPLTGGRSVGVDLAPDGLRLAVPARLEIRGGGAFPKNTVGFSNGKDGFAVGEPTRRGATLVLPIDHFSAHGGGTVTAADFANMVQPIVSNLGNLSLSQIRYLLALMATWDRMFSPPNPDPVTQKPPSFCRVQPVCGIAVRKAITSIDLLIGDRCTAGRRSPALGALIDLVDLAAQRDLLGGTGNIVDACLGDIVTSLLTTAEAADPLAVIAEVDLLPAGTGGDLDGDGTLTATEFLFVLAQRAQTLGLTTLGDRAGASATGALARIRNGGAALCATDRPAAERALLKGARYASALRIQVEEFADALDGCRGEIQISPAIVDLEPGAVQQFTATVNGIVETVRNAGVEWSASAGAITASGRYTAPATPGNYTVRATSTVNEQKFATASVRVIAPACVEPERARRRAAGPRVVQPGNITIATAADIEAIRTTGITAITGDLTIAGTALTTLDGLQGLDTVGGSVIIGGNTALRDLRGLEGLTNIGRSLLVSGNTVLETLNGLQGLGAALFSVQLAGNPELRTLSALCGLTTTQALSVRLNPSLQKLSGLDGLLDLPIGLEIARNGLTSLTGLDELETAGDVRITGAALTSLQGLGSLRSVGRLTLGFLADSPAGETLDAATLLELPALEEILTGGIDVGPGLRADQILRFPELLRLGEVGDPDVLRVLGGRLGALEAPKLAALERLELQELQGDLAITLATTGGIAGDATISNNVAGTRITAGLGSIGRDLSISRNTGLRLVLTTPRVGRAVTIGFCDAVFGTTGNFNTGLNVTGSTIGRIDGDLRVQGNVGFNDATAFGFAATTTVGGATQIFSNTITGPSPC